MLEQSRLHELRGNVEQARRITRTLILTPALTPTLTQTPTPAPTPTPTPTLTLTLTLKPYRAQARKLLRGARKTNKQEWKVFLESVLLEPRNHS
jgi:hypothetical protein